jgi:hypothetical protein
MAFPLTSSPIVIGSGPPSDALFIAVAPTQIGTLAVQSPPQDGQTYLDQVTGFLWIRFKSVWTPVRPGTGNAVNGATGVAPPTTVVGGVATVIGSTGTVTLAANSNDVAGQIIIATSGTAPSTQGAVATVTFATPLDDAPDAVVFSPASAAAVLSLASNSVYISAQTATGFVLSNTTTSFANAVTIAYNYVVL